MTKQRYIKRELENMPEGYKKPQRDEFIDRQLLTRVICNVECTDRVEYSVFIEALDAVVETLGLFPYFNVSERRPDDFQLLEDADFEP